MFDDDGFFALNAIAISICPSTQCLVQCGMIAATSRYIIENGSDTLGFPLDGFTAFFSRGAITQCPSLLRDFTLHPVSSQRIHHVAQHWVVDAVAHKTNHVVTEQLTHEACRPALGQIGHAKVPTGDHQPVQDCLVRSFRQQAMQADQPIPAAVFRNW